MHVSPKSFKDYPWYVKPFFWIQKRMHGQMLIPALVWARAPRLFLTLSLFYKQIDSKKSKIRPALRSLILVRVSQVNWCKFCVDMNSKILLDRLNESKKLDELENWKESSLFSDDEKIVLEYTEAITLSDREVTPEIMQNLKKHYDDDSIVELTGLICFQNLSTKFNNALDIPSQGFCKIPSNNK